VAGLAFAEIVPQAFHRFPGLLILAATGPRNTAESNTAGYQYGRLRIARSPSGSRDIEDKRLAARRERLPSLVRFARTLAIARNASDSAIAHGESSG